MEAPISDHPVRVRLTCRWSLTGSFTNSNLTDGGTNQDFGSKGGCLREVVMFHCTLERERERERERESLYSLTLCTDEDFLRSLLAVMSPMPLMDGR